MTPELIAEARALQKRCQIGAPDFHGAHDILADCYGKLGRLILEIERLEHELTRARAPKPVPRKLLRHMAGLTKDPRE